MVFLIQTTQNRVHLENLSDEELEALEKEFQKLHDRMNKSASGTPTKEGSDSPDGIEKAGIVDE